MNFTVSQSDLYSPCKFCALSNFEFSIIYNSKIFGKKYGKSMEKVWKMIFHIPRYSPAVNVSFIKNSNFIFSINLENIWKKVWKKYAKWYSIFPGILLRVMYREIRAPTLSCHCSSAPTTQPMRHQRNGGSFDKTAYLSFHFLGRRQIHKNSQQIWKSLFVCKCKW